MVSNLQDQNRRLQSRLNEKSSGQEAAVESKYSMDMVKQYLTPSFLMQLH